MKIIFILTIIVMISFSIERIFADNEPILITQSESMTDIVFDGKWTKTSEWKQSSHNMISFEEGNKIIHIRTAHFENFIYILIDPIFDISHDDKLDNAVVCFDAKNDKISNFDSNDFCFSAFLNSNQGITFQGTINENSQTVFKEISNHPNFIGISSVSDENDRYSKTPHPSYEFKIPIEMLERSNNYGFYFHVYDASTNKIFSWPEQSTNSNDIPHPDKWGDIISPDKSLPEFHFPLIIFSIVILTVILIQSKIPTKSF